MKGTDNMKKALSIVIILSMLTSALFAFAFTANAEDEITISSVDEWLEFAESPDTSAEAVVKVTAKELDFTGKTLTPINGFKGTFDGQGVVLKNIEMSKNSGEDLGLFCGFGGKIRNIAIEDSTFTLDNKWIGALICDTSGEALIENIYVGKNVTVTGGTDYVGGILGGCGGNAATVTIRNCMFAGTVVGKGTCGGIVGNGATAANKPHDLVIEGCMVTGKVPATKPTVSNSYACGFVGANGTAKITLTNCIYAGGPENEYYYSSPFFAHAKEAEVTGCYTVAANNIDGTPNIGSVYSVRKDSSSYDQTHTKITDENCGVIFTTIDNLRRPSSIITGFSKRGGDIVVPTGLKDIAPSFFNDRKVTWLNEDGTELAVEDYNLGDTPSFKGETPTKDGYVFKGWTPEISAVTADVKYTAVFEEPSVVIDDNTDVDTANGGEAETKAEEKGGCGSSIGVGAIALVTVIGGALAIGSKKKED